MKTKATRDSWTHHPLPDQHAALSVDWRFTPDEFEKMRYGLIPEVMEDKWFIYFEADWLYFHRSWTGFCVYKALCQPEGALYAIRQVLVSREPEQYTGTSDENDLKLLHFLIECLLLGKDAQFPYPAELNGTAKAALYKHHLVGHGRSQDEMEEDA